MRRRRRQVGEGKLWGGRFAEETDERAERFTASLPFDRRLYREDIRGSQAHARMLGETGIITRDEAERIISGLAEIKEEIEKGEFPFRIEYEDIHLNIEKRLIEKIGPLGGKLHTARSRNDQVALDMHLYMKSVIGEVSRHVHELQQALVMQAERHLGPEPVIMPGYTHLQRAQPILLSHHLLAYFWMLERDQTRLADCLRRTDVSPLGAAALAGTSYPIDRVMVAKELGFSSIYPNSIDAVSDRDFLIEFLACAAMIMMHLSRLCEEIILWSSAEFAFVELPDAFSTGSSIMPQKKNPDVAELVRGKAGRVYGHLVGLLTVMKGLPLAYHTDMQEDKEAVFDTVDTLKAALPALTGLVSHLRWRPERIRAALCGDFSNATDLADHLVRKGMPFREAHEVVGKIVRYCIEKGKTLEDLDAAELVRFSPLFQGADPSAFDHRRVVEARLTAGGTAPGRVREQLAMARAIIDERGGQFGKEI